jgi:rhodanese-related sulfurtransferase
MKKNISNIMILILLTLLLTPAALAQYLVISAEEVQSWMTGKGNVALIDVRMPEEYQAGHIPGAINIPAERILADRNMLPKDRTTQLIVYCRGTG